MKTELIGEAQDCEIIAINVVSGIFYGQSNSDLIHRWKGLQTELALSEITDTLRLEASYKNACFLVNSVIDNLTNTRLNTKAWEDLRSQNCFNAAEVFFDGVSGLNRSSIESVECLLRCAMLFSTHPSKLSKLDLDTLQYSLKIIVDSLTYALNQYHDERIT